MFKDIKKMIAISLTVIFFIGLDRFLKVFALTDLGNARNLLGDILKFDFKANYHVAFSLPLAGVWLNIVICLIILSLVYYLVRMWQAGKREIAICLFAIVVGAASNLFDRFKYGYVIDYLDLKYFTVFNLADVMIVVGVFLLLLNANNKEAA